MMGITGDTGGVTFGRQETVSKHRRQYMSVELTQIVVCYGR